MCFNVVCLVFVVPGFLVFFFNIFFILLILLLFPVLAVCFTLRNIIHLLLSQAV